MARDWGKREQIEKEWGLPLSDALVKALNTFQTELKTAMALEVVPNTVRYYRRRFGIVRNEEGVWAVNADAVDGDG